MPDNNVEIFLARLYADRCLREQFLLDPLRIAAQHGLSAQECGSVARMPAQDLQTAARSFEKKRSFKMPPGYAARVRNWISRLLGSLVGVGKAVPLRGPDKPGWF
jgi:hypothetical protein